MFPHVLVCGHACAMAHIWRLDDSLQDLILFIHYVDPGPRTQVIKLSAKPLYPLSPPVPLFVFYEALNPGLLHANGLLALYEH